MMQLCLVEMCKNVLVVTESNPFSMKIMNGGRRGALHRACLRDLQLYYYYEFGRLMQYVQLLHDV